MNSSRRIQSLRPHRQRIPSASLESWPKPYCGCGEQWCIDELATYLLITMIVLIALWGAWAKRDMYE